MTMVDVLTKLNMSFNISPKGLVNFLITDKPTQDRVISYFYKDLQFEEGKHNKGIASYCTMYEHEYPNDFG